MRVIKIMIGLLFIIAGIGIITAMGLAFQDKETPLEMPHGHQWLVFVMILIAVPCFLLLFGLSFLIYNKGLPDSAASRLLRYPSPASILWLWLAVIIATGLYARGVYMMGTTSSHYDEHATYEVKRGGNGTVSGNELSRHARGVYLFVGIGLYILGSLGIGRFFGEAIGPFANKNAVKETKFRMHHYVVASIAAAIALALPLMEIAGIFF